LSECREFTIMKMAVTTYGTANKTPYSLALKFRPFNPSVRKVMQPYAAQLCRK